METLFSFLMWRPIQFLELVVSVVLIGLSLLLLRVLRE